MGSSFIVRKGGGAGDATPPPTISFVSKTTNSVTFTITNNSLKPQDITYGLSTPPTTTTISLAGEATSTNQTISNITGFVVTIFAKAEESAITEFRVRLSFPPTFIEATGGTTQEYNSGGKRFKSHTFTSNGDFVVTQVGNVDESGSRNQVDYFILAGGAGGGRDSNGTGPGGAGGGAGGFRTTISPTPSNTAVNAKIIVTQSTFPVIVGAGGSGGAPNTGGGAPGGNSSALGITATGGGGGGSPSSNPGSGGSGGGGQRSTGGAAGIVGQGHNGGNGPTSNNGAGGGGAGSAGATSARGGALGNTLRTGSSISYGLGGAHANADTSNQPANTGNAGGGANWTNQGPPGNGGSGIVVIRYEIPTV